jgi:hypothetical protein
MRFLSQRTQALAIYTFLPPNFIPAQSRKIRAKTPLPIVLVVVVLVFLLRIGRPSPSHRNASQHPTAIPLPLLFEYLPIA